MLEIIVIPNIQVTKSKFKTPTSPQLSPPIITKANAIESKMLNFLFIIIFLKIILMFRPFKEYIYYSKKREKVEEKN